MTKFDQIDLKVIAALQSNPRAAWSRIGAAAGIDALTAQRRWTRIESAGAGWLSSYAPFESGLIAAYVAINCQPGAAIAVAQAIAQIPQAMTVNIEAGSRDILVEIVTREARDLAHLVLEQLGAIAGIASVTTMPIIRIYADASQWRAFPLGKTAVDDLSVETPAITNLSASRPLSEDARMVAAAISEDPRISVSDLAARLGTSQATARRRLDELLSRHRMLRCDIARELSPWPVRATFMADVPIHELDQAAEKIVRLPETRSVISVAGKANLVIAVWLQSQEHVQSFEMSMTRAIPQLRVLDRSIEIRPVKLSGQLLGEDGLSTGRVLVAL